MEPCDGFIQPIGRWASTSVESRYHGIPDVFAFKIVTLSKQVAFKAAVKVYTTVCRPVLKTMHAMLHPN